MVKFGKNERKRQKVRELTEKGLTQVDIAKVLQVDQSSVSKMAKRMGLPPPPFGHPPNEAKRQKVRELTEKGLTQVEIAKVMGISQSSVSKFAKRMGLPPPPTRR